MRTIDGDASPARVQAGMRSSGRKATRQNQSVMYGPVSIVHHVPRWKRSALGSRIQRLAGQKSASGKEHCTARVPMLMNRHSAALCVASSDSTLS